MILYARYARSNSTYELENSKGCKEHLKMKFNSQ